MSVFTPPDGLPARLIGPGTACVKCGATKYVHGRNGECPK